MATLTIHTGTTVTYKDLESSTGSFDQKAADKEKQKKQPQKWKKKTGRQLPTWQK